MHKHIHMHFHTTAINHFVNSNMLKIHEQVIQILNYASKSASHWERARMWMLANAFYWQNTS